MAKPEEFGLSPRRAHAYTDSGGPLLQSVLKQIAIAPGSKILDYGSGKGGALFTMAKFPFDEIVGVELSPVLIAIAKCNLQKLSIRRSVRMVCADAADFTALDDFTHVYLFNPFPPNVTAQVCRNLLDSVKRRPRLLILIGRYSQNDFQVHFGDTQIPPAFHLFRIIQFKHSQPFYILVCR